MKNFAELGRAASSQAQGYFNNRADQARFSQMAEGVSDFMTNYNTLKQNQASLANIQNSYDNIAQNYQQQYDDPNTDPATKAALLDRIGELSMVSGMTNLSNIGNYADNYSKIVKTDSPAKIIANYKLQEIKNKAMLQAAGIQANARIKSAQTMGDAWRAKEDYKQNQRFDFEDYRNLQNKSGAIGVGGLLKNQPASIGSDETVFGGF